jgi:hypothetical protein
MKSRGPPQEFASAQHGISITALFYVGRASPAVFKKSPPPLYLTEPPRHERARSAQHKENEAATSAVFVFSIFRARN